VGDLSLASHNKMFFLSCSAELPILSPVYSFVPLALQNERTKRTTKEKEKRKRKAERNIEDKSLPAVWLIH
jgi:hypothetical protein